jgi:hypothetical protein
MEELDEQNKKVKTKRLIIWAVFLIVIGGVASVTLPEHSLPYFIDLLKEIITSLIVV